MPDTGGYALYNAWLACQAWRLRHRGPKRPAPPETWPLVTVQLPIYDEAAVAPLLAAVASLDYPRDRLGIQVLDDSSDAQARRNAQFVATLQSRTVPIVHLHRTHRDGYKAGALAAGLQSARGTLILLLDADFIPQVELLRRLVPWFSAPRVGMVQARWGNGGAERNLLTRCAAYWIDRHFCIDQVARSRSGQFFHFNGSAGMWRRSAIEDAGGWQADTLAEDMDLSFRAWERGWQFIYDHDVVVPAQIPPDAAALRIQQERWACGTFQVAKQVLPRFATAGHWGHATVSFLHLTGYCFTMLLLFLALTAGLTSGASASPLSTLCIYMPGLIFSGYIALRVGACWLTGGWRPRHVSRVLRQSAAPCSQARQAPTDCKSSVSSSIPAFLAGTTKDPFSLTDGLTLPVSHVSVSSFPGAPDARATSQASPCSLDNYHHRRPGIWCRRLRRHLVPGRSRREPGGSGSVWR